MKTYFFALTFLFALFYQVQAQEVGEQIITDEDLKLISTNQRRTTFLDIDNDRIRFNLHFFSKIKYPNYRKIKKGRVYDSIVVRTKQNVYVYFKAKVTKKSNANRWMTFDYLSDVFYTKTGTIYMPNKFNEDGNLPINEPIYYSNGALERYGFLEENNAIRYMRYLPNGNLKYSFTDRTFDNIKTTNHPKYGTINERYWSKYNLQPNMISANGNVYYGYPNIGTLHTKSGYKLTGFFLPLQKLHGNGSVLFLENENTNTYYWVLVIDKKIREIISAKAEDAPDIESLYAQTDTESLNFENISLNKNYSYVHTDGKVYGHQITKYAPEIVKMRTKNIENHSGYGIDLSYKDYKAWGDDINLQVGFFKEGTLNGLGYNAHLVYNQIKDQRVDFKTNATSINWDIDMGFFENNILKGGSQVYTKIPITVSSDVFSKMPYKNFIWKSYSTNLSFSDKVVPLSAVDKKFYIFSSKLNRKLVATQVDNISKTITVATDINDSKHIFTKADEGTLFSFQSNMQDYKEPCQPYVIKDVYENKKVPLYNLGGSKKAVAYYVKDGRKNYIYASTGKADKIIYTEKSIKTGSRKENCPICNGTGYVTKSKQKGAYCKIEF